MDFEDVEKLIQTGEGYNLEFKSRLSKSIAKEIVAFANESGGKIVVGINDKNKIIGYNFTNKERSKLDDILKNNIDPEIEIDIKEFNNLLLIKVPEGKKKPYSSKGKFYRRTGSSSQKLSHEEIIDFLQHENRTKFGEIPNKKFKLDQDFNIKAYDNFIAKCSITSNLSKKEILGNIGLIYNAKLKNAGVLFFYQGYKKVLP